MSEIFIEPFELTRNAQGRAHSQLTSATIWSAAESVSRERLSVHRIWCQIKYQLCIWPRGCVEMWCDEKEEREVVEGRCSFGFMICRRSSSLSLSPCCWCLVCVLCCAVQAGDKHYHPSCARCSRCNQMFTEGEEMYLQGEHTFVYLILLASCSNWNWRITTPVVGWGGLVIIKFFRCSKTDGRTFLTLQHMIIY